MDIGNFKIRAQRGVPADVHASASLRRGRGLVWMLDRMKKPIRLLVAGASFYAAAGNCDSSCATEQCATAARIPDLTDDIRSFVERRDGCDHFRGEPTDFDESYLKRGGEEALQEQKERAEFVNQNIVTLCAGTDRQLQALRARHEANPTVLKLLNSYEPKVESGSN